jgi:hypothetical protein
MSKRHQIREVQMLKRTVASLLLLGAGFLLGTPALAQSNGDGFLFRRPVSVVTIRTGVDVPHAGSDIFSSFTKDLTITRRDFRAFNIAGDVAFHLRNRLQAYASIGQSRSVTSSEFRDFIDNNDMPIEQKTTLSRVPVTLGVKVFLTEPGRSVARRAWIPARLAPYAGGGAGMMWYRLTQKGDFVDFDTMNVFPDTFQSSGFAPTATAFGGFEINIHPRFTLTIEGRQTWAKAKLGRDFSGFAPIDLSGFAITTGFSIRF